MLDFLPEEAIYFACLLNGRPTVLHLRYVRRSRAQSSRKNPWLVARNEHGTEQAFPLKYVFKCREDAEEKSQELEHRGRPK